MVFYQILIILKWKSNEFYFYQVYSISEMTEFFGWDYVELSWEKTLFDVSNVIYY